MTRIMNDDERANLVEVPMPRVAGFDLSKEMAQRPYAVLGLGALAGYVLGGGLFTRLTGRILATGLRAVAVPLATKAAIGLVESAMQSPSASQTRPQADGEPIPSGT